MALQFRAERGAELRRNALGKACPATSSRPNPVSKKAPSTTATRYGSPFLSPLQIRRDGGRGTFSRGVTVDGGDGRGARGQQGS
eukprot:7170697-Pyramimonas_sp.AAC.1